jgi:DNA-binding transcriptional LysR family regulator
MKISPQLICFIKAAEFKHFALAAENLNISPTALSKQIKVLEQEIAMQLFVRTTRHVSLTEFGELLYKRCKKIHQEMLQLNQFIENKKGIPQGQLKVLVSTILAKSFILKNLTHFRETYPDIELELIFAEDNVAFYNKKVDVMVGFPEIVPFTNDLKYRKIHTVSNILCASPNYIKRYGMPLKETDLLNKPLISHTLRKPNHALPLANGKYIEISTPVLLMNQFDALNQACLDGHGAFLTADILVEKYLKSGELINILPQIKFCSYEIYIFYQSYDYELPKVRAFVDFYYQTSVC